MLGQADEGMLVGNREGGGAEAVETLRLVSRDKNQGKCSYIYLDKNKRM